MSLELQVCTFYLDGLFFGVEVQKVQEVLRHQDMTRVPLAGTVIGGLINLRGQIVTAIDLRRRLGFGDRPEGQAPMNVVVRCDDGAVSLLVDEIGDVLEVEDGAFEPPPDTVKAWKRDLVRGIYKLEGKLLVALDVDKLVQLDAASA